MANGNTLPPGLLGAPGGVQGLLSSPLFNIGAGLLSAAGPSLQPVGIGQGLVQGLNMANQGALSQLQIQAARQRLQESARRNQAMSRVPEIVAGLGIPEEQQAPLGILAQAAPEAFTQGLLTRMFGQERSEPADLRIMDALGLPRTAEGFQQLQQLKGGDLEALMQEVNLRQRNIETQLIEERLAAARQEREQAQRTEADRKATGRQAAVDSIRGVQQMANSLSAIEQSPWLRPGTGVDRFGRAGIGIINVGKDLVGMPDHEQERLLAEYDTFKRLASGAVFEHLDALKGVTITDAKFKQLRDTIIDQGSHPDAIRRALADIAEAGLRAAEKFGADVDKKAIEAQIKELRTPRASQPQAPTQADLEFTARKHGITVEEVKRRLGIE